VLALCSCHQFCQTSSNCIAKSSLMLEAAA
jgi:hypothetical protein